MEAKTFFKTYLTRRDQDQDKMTKTETKTKTSVSKTETRPRHLKTSLETVSRRDMSRDVPALFVCIICKWCY